jgi:hypothetical protein
MSKSLMKSVVIVLIGAALAVPSLRGQSLKGWFLDFETGGAFLGYCDVQIPGTSAGTRFSLTDDLESTGSVFVRLRAGLSFGRRNMIWVLLAPLSLDGSGELPHPIDYNGVRFPAGVSLKSTYRFNSWRLSYQYRIKESEKLKIGLGLTAKIRDAGISLEGGGLESKKTNVGFVPIINFLVDWRFSPAWSLVFEGDALAAPQGRAEDVFLGLEYRRGRHWSFRGGYRLLEGGADNDEVYNFALVNYLSLGASYVF